MAKKLKITDIMIQEFTSDEFDKSYLHRPLFKVNMRLYKNSPSYRAIIKDVIAYMSKLLDSHYEDYEDIRGISCANIGIPWNIIAFKTVVGHKFMINPWIVKWSPTLTRIKSNCGSLRLKEEIAVDRYLWIKVKYFDENGTQQEDHLTREQGAFIVQHEVDHNIGITLLERHSQEERTEKSEDDNLAAT